MARDWLITWMEQVKSQIKKTTHSMSPFVHAKESQMFKLLQHASIAYSVLSVDAMSYFFYTKSPIP